MVQIIQKMVGDRTQDLIVANDNIVHAHLTENSRLQSSPADFFTPTFGSITEAQRGRSVCLLSTGYPEAIRKGYPPKRSN
jgi:hypothetical protein